MHDTTIWQLDPAHTTVEFAVKHMMFTTVRGRFKNFTGTVHVNEKNPDRSKVEVEIDASSIDTGVGDRDAHLRSADFLDVEQHPKITFRSRRVQGAHSKEGERFKVSGDLEIRGKSMPVVRTYGDVGIGELCGLVGSSGWLEVACRAGSAADRLGLAPGIPVVLRRA